MPRPVPLGEAIATHVHDGDLVALEGFTHLIPFAAAHELARQGRRHLKLVRMTPDLVYDQLIGLGIVDELVFSYGGNPGVGSLHRLRDAVEHHWPHRLAVHEHSHAGLANAYVAGAARLPFAVLRGYRGTDLEDQRDIVDRVTCPFTGEELAAVRAVNPDVTVIHAQLADRDGNVMFWGITGVQREAVLAAERAIVTVEEVVDVFPERTGAVVLPSWVLSAVCVVPGGAWPSYAAGYSVRDNSFYQQWDEIARDRAKFLAWAEENDLV
ncbi:glutaconate CoA-transferase subunit A [Kribbella amoyensis]|uniref:Glutaconate CoA-transferase subunit A n=1 Tax=Kribbella amoyensis TaxID=996641 RepID=A0A561B7Z4_9ACTN|nr:CoA-transferase [Kribbella amoyensis]TWD75085.1 glutaconate CoA-transferase subunit A [Kribbella amoyensis]